MTRTVLASGLLFAGLTLIAFHGVGWMYDAWIVLPLMAAHVLLVQRSEAELTRSLTLFHYGLLLIVLAGILVPLFLQLPSMTKDWHSLTLQQIARDWQAPGQSLIYLVSGLGIFCVVYFVGRLLGRNAGSSRSGLGATLFVFSVLQVLAAFVVEDIVAGMGAERPDEAADFVVAALFSSLALPVLFHLLAIAMIFGLSLSGGSPSKATVPRS